MRFQERAFHLRLVHVLVEDLESVGISAERMFGLISSRTSYLDDIRELLPVLQRLNKKAAGAGGCRRPYVDLTGEDLLDRLGDEQEQPLFKFAVARRLVHVPKHSRHVLHARAMWHSA